MKVMEVKCDVRAHGTWAFPGLWTTSSCKRSNHRASWPSGSLKFLSQESEPWLVRSVNLRQTKYGRYWRTKVTTARSSLRVTHSGSRLPNAMTPYITPLSDRNLSSNSMGDGRVEPYWRIPCTLRVASSWRSRIIMVMRGSS